MFLGERFQPLEGIGPDELHVAELMARLSNPDITEVILATNPNVEGETTASYLGASHKADGCYGQPSCKWVASRGRPRVR